APHALLLLLHVLVFFFLSVTPTTYTSTLSLHDALPICQEGDHVLHVGSCLTDAAHVVHREAPVRRRRHEPSCGSATRSPDHGPADRKSTRLNSSHVKNSYAVFCLKKKNKKCIYGNDTNA